jgi:hypothetical protein
MVPGPSGDVVRRMGVFSGSVIFHRRLEHDPQTWIREVSALLAQEESQDGEAAESWHVFHTNGR